MDNLNTLTPFRIIRPFQATPSYDTVPTFYDFRHSHLQARIQGGGRWGGRPPLGRKDPRRRRGFPRLKGRKKGHWCLLNGCSTPFRHNMAINILKSCKYVFAYVKNRSFPSHIRSSFPWRPPLAEILDPRLIWS